MIIGDSARARGGTSEAFSALIRHSIAWPSESNLALVDGQRRAGGDFDLLIDEIDAGDHFRHRMFDLNARVHFDEIEPAVFVEKFDGAGAE